MSAILEQLARSRETTPEVFPDPAPGNWQATADAAVEGRLPFTFRDEPILTGRRDVDWSGRHVKHQEWPAQLNRFGYVGALGRAWRRTGREEYARAARDYIEDWIDHHEPYDPACPRAPVGDSTLNMAVRLGGTRHAGWLGWLPGLAGCPAFDEALAEKIVRSIEWQLAWLAGNLPAWGNWRVAALDCLLSQGLRLPGRLDGHVPLAVEGLNTAFARQILPDGVHVERSGGYHDWMCGVFVALWRLGRRRGEFGLDLDDGRIAAMHAYTLHHTKPNAALCGFNDARASVRTDPAAPERMRSLVRAHRELLAETGAPEPPAPPAARFFTTAGHVFYRTGWGTDDLWWAFDAGGWGGGHSHLSRLSVELHNGRRTTLPDAGIFDYEMSNPLAAVGKGTPAHSTMNVELANQADVSAVLVRAEELPGAVVVQGRYEGGYWPGAFKWRFSEGRGRGYFGAHDRTVVWIKDRAMVVLDCLRHEQHARAFLHWLSDDVPLEPDADGLGARTGDEQGNVLLRVCAFSEGELSASVHRGERDPALGWVGGEHFKVRPAPLLQFAFRTPNTDRNSTAFTECATVIVPFTGPEAPRVVVTGRTAEPLVRQVEIRWPDGAADRLIYTRQLAHPIRRLDEVRTDASLLVVRTAPGRDDRVAAVDATFIRIGERQVPV